jgi:outer membrane lipoprotein carrier protein
MRKIAICLLLSLLASTNTWAGDPTPKDIARNLQKIYRQTRSLTADFKQVASSITGRHKRRGAGTMQLLKPGRMRWDYMEPDQQVVICDGKSVSMYFAKQKQMIVSPAKQYLESDVTYSFFAGTGDIIRDFDVQSPDPDDLDKMAGTYQIKIIPRHSHPQVDYINLWVDAKSYLLKRVKVTDKFGSQTDISFTNIKRNVDISPAVFNYMPPLDTEIIKQ